MDRFLIKKPAEPTPSTSRQSSSSSSENEEQERITIQDPIPTAESRKCREEWLKEFTWLVNKNDKAYCKCCDKFLEGGRMHMKRHQTLNLHTKNVKKLKGAVSIEKCLISEEKKKELLQKKEAQLKMAIHLAEHNLSFAYMEHANQFYSHLFPDSQIAANFNCSRSKMTQLIKTKIAPYVRENLSKKLNSCSFSIIIDETTDISTKKIIGSSELEVATSEKIFSVICELFKDNQVNINNLMGFASDNASVMMGDIKGVKARLLEIIPNLFVMPCISHSLHLCASKACKVLPSDLEKLCHEIYNYFAHSAKRQKVLQEFQVFANTQPHQLLRPSQTRWLSLHMVVERICEQWQALTLYFQGEVLDDNIINATFILDCLNNPVFKVYFKFLKYILTLITRLNTFFQSESPKFHVFLENITSIYKTILKFYIKPEIVNSKIPLSRINPANPDYYLQLQNIYLGIEAEQFITSLTLDQVSINSIKVKCLDFYSKLCSEIRNRVDFSDETLNMLQILNPKTIFLEEKPSLASLVTRFPNVIKNENLLDLDLEWRQLSNVKPPTDINNIEEVINYLNKAKNGVGELLFPNLFKE
ncbi:hypothetical protein NQ315_006574 [Exocentrus adspersus]|uniref:DUF4371 domain-containing protein n=1 Tax=Exocentrus adspersus TaxID=1586481 RepID=A0AAV8VFZ2_9CUCU|nr:hypothetical protein NQ315_006574 [Exocentrus adspersus]